MTQEDWNERVKKKKKQDIINTKLGQDSKSLPKEETWKKR
jgi:hypothetical protein